MANETMSVFAAQNFGDDWVDMQNDVQGRAVAMKRAECAGVQIYDGFDKNTNGAATALAASARNRLPGTTDMVDKCKIESQVRGSFPTDGQVLTLHASHMFPIGTGNAVTARLRETLATVSVDNGVARALQDTETVDVHRAIPTTVKIALPVGTATCTATADARAGAEALCAGVVDDWHTGATAGNLEALCTAASSQCQFTTEDPTDSFKPNVQGLGPGDFAYADKLSVNGYNAERTLCEIAKAAYTDGLTPEQSECTSEEVSVTGALWGASRIFHDTAFLQNLADHGAGGFATWVSADGSGSVSLQDESLRAGLQARYNELQGGARLLDTTAAHGNLIQQEGLRQKMACAMTFTVNNAAHSAKRSQVGDGIAALADHVNGVVCADVMGGVLT